MTLAQCEVTKIIQYNEAKFNYFRKLWIVILIFLNIFFVGLTIKEIPTSDTDKTNPRYSVK